MKINNKVENGKRQFASWLTTSSERHSLHTKKRFFIITGLACSAVCLSFILNPLLHHEEVSNSARQPTVISRALESDTIITMEDQLALEGFMHSLDSIKRVDSATYDQAMKGREGLLDSIRFLLQYAGKSLTQQ